MATSIGGVHKVSSLARVMLVAGCKFCLESHVLLFLRVVLILIEILTAKMNSLVGEF